MELSTEIKDARRKLGLSQSQAAKAWDIPLSTLQDWEQGQHKPRGLALKTLRTILAAALSGDKPASPSSAAPEAPGAPPKEKRRRRSSATSPPRKRKPRA